MRRSGALNWSTRQAMWMPRLRLCGPVAEDCCAYRSLVCLCTVWCVPARGQNIPVLSWVWSWSCASYAPRACGRVRQSHFSTHSNTYTSHRVRLKIFDRTHHRVVPRVVGTRLFTYAPHTYSRAYPEAPKAPWLGGGSGRTGQAAGVSWLDDLMPSEPRAWASQPPVQPRGSN